ncbi:hypothetical protein EVAR_6516_1 [Eumeta japonica]|uniref:Ionotropic glutamate receptor L-glutamate and glycine-binding domain-containing protein n=1 Tax=Eumeta variegata TaxID=151549 RepID=A0A4C1STC4_EUMVA|nr:hypothetical protein EVAR_6516_1 [Eumeta japonica]
MDPNKTNNQFNLLLNASEAGCSDYIVDTRDVDKFLEDLEELNHAGYIRRSDRKLILILSNRQNLPEILKKNSIRFLADLLFIVPVTENVDECQKYELITHQFVGTGEIDTPLYLDQWDACTEKFVENANLFPARYERYGRWINCTVELIKENEGQWGQIFDNRTGDGVLGAVVEDRVDVGITALYSWYHEWTFLDFSAPYIRSGITCLAPAPRAIPSWQLPILPFSLWVWIAVLSTFIYASIALSVIQEGSIAYSVFITFGMMITQHPDEITAIIEIGAAIRDLTNYIRAVIKNSSRVIQSQPNVGYTWKVRSVTGWLLITGLIIDNAYGGGLASTFTVPKFEKSIDTMQDLVDSNLEWGATHDAWVFSMTLSSDPKIMSLVKQFRVYDAGKLHNKSFTRSMAFSIEKLPSGSFAIGDYITRKAMPGLELILEEFYWEQCVLTARKNSPYTSKVTDFVGRLHGSGLILAWETQVAQKYLDNDIQQAVRLSRSQKDVKTAPLDFHHVVVNF